MCECINQAVRELGKMSSDLNKYMFINNFLI